MIFFLNTQKKLKVRETISAKKLVCKQHQTIIKQIWCSSGVILLNCRENMNKEKVERKEKRNPKLVKLLLV